MENGCRTYSVKCRSNLCFESDESRQPLGKRPAFSAWDRPISAKIPTRLNVFGSSHSMTLSFSAWAQRMYEKALRVLTAGICGLMLVGSPAAGQNVDVSKLPPAAARAVNFVNDIQPILEQSCLKCHNPDVSMSGLRLDDREHALKGGRS